MMGMRTNHRANASPWTSSRTSRSSWGSMPEMGLPVMFLTLSMPLMTLRHHTPAML